MFQFDAHELSDLAKELPDMGRLAVEAVRDELNAAMRTIFDSEHDKPVDKVLPVVRKMSVPGVTFDEEMFEAIAERISAGKVPIMILDTDGSMSLDESSE